MQDSTHWDVNLLEGHALQFLLQSAVRLRGNGLGLQAIGIAEEIVIQRVQLKQVLIAVYLGNRVEDTEGLLLLHVIELAVRCVTQVGIQRVNQAVEL